MSSITLKLLIDPEKNRVVFAESEKEFVDVLFSFLTLPIGIIIRLLNKNSNVGCIDNVYRSVEHLDTKHLNTEACKTMLLEPRSSAERLCEDLLFYVDDFEPRRLYRCPDFDCFTKKSKAYSSVADVICSCGKTMDSTFEWTKVKKGKQEVFLKGEATYMISDDLNVLPASVSNAVRFFKKMGIDDVGILEQKVVEVNRDELLNILKMLLVSKTPLTDVFLKKPCSHSRNETAVTKLFDIKLEDGNEGQGKKAILKLMRDKITKRVLYAEADNVVVDTFFSFLTFPLGAAVKLLNGTPLLGCVDNLYNSVDILVSNNICIASEDCKEKLLSPCLCLHYGCSHQLLKIESEAISRTSSVHGCKICGENVVKGNCVHNIGKVSVKEINPKMPNLTTVNGGGYAINLMKFMITDEMMITPLTLLSGIDVVKDFKVSVRNLVFQEVAIGEAERVHYQSISQEIFVDTMGFVQKQSRCDMYTSDPDIKTSFSCLDEKLFSKEKFLLKC